MGIIDTVKSMSLTPMEATALLAAVASINWIDKDVNGFRVSDALFEGELRTAWGRLGGTADNFFAKDSRKREELFRLIATVAGVGFGVKVISQITSGVK